MTNLDFNLLKTFLTVANLESITKASNELYISQPAVSQNIKKLEEQLGGTLFYRSNKGIKLTDEGKCFYNYVKNAFSLIEKGQDEFENFRQFKKGTVNIGISTVLTKLILTNCLREFNKAYPNIKIKITNDLSSSLIEGLDKGLYDFVIINKSGEITNKFNLTPLKQLEYCFIYNKDMFSFPDEIPLNEIKNIPLIIQKKSSNTRQVFDDFIYKNNISIDPQTEVVSQELVQFLSNEGMGVGLAFKNLINFSNSNFKELKTNPSIPSSEIILAENNNKIQSFASMEFKKFLLKNIKNN